MYDVIIVGAGPAGLTAGIFARARKLRTLIIDAYKAGGQLLSVYPTKTIYDYPSFEAINAAELARRLVEHALKDGCELREQEAVRDVLAKGENLEVATANGSYETRTVILSIGMGLFEPRKLGVPGEEKFRGKGVYYALPDLGLLEGKRVLVVGGGDAALEMALGALKASSEVTLIHRRAEFRAMESIVEAVRNSKVNLKLDHECKEFLGDDRLQGALILDNKTGEQTRLQIDVVIIGIGFLPNMDRAREWGIALEGSAIKVTSDMRTTKRGIFACGDIVAFPGKTNRIITACGGAAIAANSAYRYIKKPYWD